MSDVAKYAKTGAIVVGVLALGIGALAIGPLIAAHGVAAGILTLAFSAGLWATAGAVSGALIGAAKSIFSRKHCTHEVESNTRTTTISKTNSTNDVGQEQNQQAGQSTGFQDKVGASRLQTANQR